MSINYTVTSYFWSYLLCYLSVKRFHLWKLLASTKKCWHQAFVSVERISNKSAKSCVCNSDVNSNDIQSLCSQSEHTFNTIHCFSLCWKLLGLLTDKLVWQHLFFFTKLSQSRHMSSILLDLPKTWLIFFNCFSFREVHEQRFQGMGWKHHRDWYLMSQGASHIPYFLKSALRWLITISA